jgi:uncharacterized protein YggE
MRNKSIIVVSFLLIAALLSGCGAAAAAPAFAQGQQPTPTASAVSTASPRTITVSGTGKAYLTPDIAYIYIGVHTEGKDAAEAVASNNTLTQKVIDAIKSFNVASKDIQTTNFSIYPQQQYDNTGKSQGITYMVDNTVYVTLRDLTKIGDLLNGAVSAGANSINGIQFDVTDKTAALSEARKAAMADAQSQAEELATAANVSLGAVQEINASTTNSSPIPLYGKGGGAALAAPEASVPVSSGQLDVTVNVNVVYEIK